MGEHHLSGAREEHMLTHQVIADVHMPAHDLGLFWAQLSWLQQNRIRDTYFADIVERCAESKFSKLFLTASHGSANLQRVEGYTLGMTGGFVIAQIQGSA